MVNGIRVLGICLGIYSPGTVHVCIEQGRPLSSVGVLRPDNRTRTHYAVGQELSREVTQSDRRRLPCPSDTVSSTARPEFLMSSQAHNSYCKLDSAACMYNLPHPPGEHAKKSPFALFVAAILIVSGIVLAIYEWLNASSVYDWAAGWGLATPLYLIFIGVMMSDLDSAESLRKLAEPIATELNLPTYAESDFVSLRRMFFALLLVLTLLSVVPLQYQWSFVMWFLVTFGLLATEISVYVFIGEMFLYLVVVAVLSTISLTIATKTHPLGGQILERLQEIEAEEKKREKEQKGQQEKAEPESASPDEGESDLDFGFSPDQE